MLSHYQNLSSGTPVEPGLYFWSPELNTDWGICCCHCCSFAKFCLILQPHAMQYSRPPCLSPSPRVCPSSCPLNHWCHSTISWSLLKLLSIGSVMPSNHLIFYCPLLLLPSISPASGSFPVSWLFASYSQSIGASASASVPPMNIQDWFPLGLTVLISLQSRGCSIVLSNTTVQKHQFFNPQPSLWSNSHIHTWLLEKP